MPDRTNKAERYRKRAEELREIAKGIFDPKERALLREIANEYAKFGREQKKKLDG
jgi:hypothetical protein